VHVAKKKAFGTSIAVMAVVLAGCATSEDPVTSGAGGGAGGGDVIYVGQSAPYSGAAAFYGEYITNGGDLAEADFADKLEGHDIEVVSEDDGCSPEGAAGTVESLLTDDRLQAIIGPGCSGAMAAAQQTMADAGMVHFCGCYLPSLSEQGDEFFFRTVPTDKQLMAALAENAAADNDSVAIVHGTSGYSVGVAEAFEAAAEEIGMKVVSVDTYDEGATDFSGQVSRLRDSDADAFFFGGYEAELGLLVRQTRQFGADQPIFGPTAMGNKEFIHNTAEAGEGVVFATNFILGDSQTQEFTDAYRDEFDSDPTDVVASNYLVMATLIDALSRAGFDASGAELRDAVRETDLDTPLGHVSFDERGDVNDPRILIGTVTDGEAEVADSQN
jgi:branched-chain amino acid transport system substrate-binding protein